MSWSGRKIVALSLVFAVGTFSFMAWYVLQRAVLIEAASSFFVPAVAFLCLSAAFLTGTLIWQEKTFAAIAVLLFFFPSILQAPTFSHVLLVTLAAFLAFGGWRRIQGELKERIHVSVRRSLFLGMAFLSFSLSLAVSSQYFVHVKTLPWERLVPSFDLAEGVGPIVIRVIQPFYPEIGKLQDKSVTVDDFLREAQVSEKETPTEIAPVDQEALWQAELERTKKELSRLLGREVLGTENMQTLLTEVLRKKTIALVAEETNRLPVPILPLFLTILLFLTLYPVFAFALPVAGGVAYLLFTVFLKLGWVRLGRVPVEQEVIEG